jgi:hypothetical protein
VKATFLITIKLRASKSRETLPLSWSGKSWLYLPCITIISMVFTVADGRIFCQIIQKRPQKISWAEKIGGRKMAKFGIKRQKRGRKIFLQVFR